MRVLLLTCEVLAFLANTWNAPKSDFRRAMTEERLNVKGLREVLMEHSRQVRDHRVAPLPARVRFGIHSTMKVSDRKLQAMRRDEIDRLLGKYLKKCLELRLAELQAQPEITEEDLKELSEKDLQVLKKDAEELEAVMGEFQRHGGDPSEVGQAMAREVVEQYLPAVYAKDSTVVEVLNEEFAPVTWFGQPEELTTLLWAWTVHLLGEMGLLHSASETRRLQD